MTVVLLHNPCLPQTRLFLWCWFCMYCCLAHCPQSCRKSLQRVLRKRNYIFGYHPHGATQLPSILSSAWGSCEQRQKAEGAMPGSTPKLSGLSTSPSREPRIRGDQHGGVVQLRHGGLSTKIPKNITRCRKPCSNPYRTPSRNSSDPQNQALREATDFSALFPGIDLRLLTLGLNFRRSGVEALGA